MLLQPSVVKDESKSDEQICDNQVDDSSNDIQVAGTANYINNYKCKNNSIFNLISFDINIKYKTLKYEHIRPNQSMEEAFGYDRMMIEIVTKNLQINI